MKLSVNTRAWLLIAGLLAGLLALVAFIFVSVAAVKGAECWDAINHAGPENISMYNGSARPRDAYAQACQRGEFGLLLPWWLQDVTWQFWRALLVGLALLGLFAGLVRVRLFFKAWHREAVQWLVEREEKKKVGRS